jgi:serine O-acetyltransferase
MGTMRCVIASECEARGHHKFSGVCSDLSGDIVRYLTKSPANVASGDTFKTRLSAFLTPDLLCLLLYRVSHYFYVNQWSRIAAAIGRLNSFVHRVTITPQSCIAAGCRLPHPSNVTFHGRAGAGLTLYSSAVCCPKEPVLDIPVIRGPTLGERVTIGAHSVVMGPIHLGDDTKVAFTVWVDHDVPARSLVVSAALRHTLRSRFAHAKSSGCLHTSAACGANEESADFGRK